MNIISGRVALAGTRIGIAGLLVEVFDVDPAVRPDEVFAGAAPIEGAAATVPTTASVVPMAIPSDRIGSVLTDDDGAFELAYEDDEFRIRNPQERRPDLFIRIQAPEVPGSDDDRELYRSRLLRENAGRREACLVWLGAEDLQRVRMPVPAALRELHDPVEDVKDRVLNSEARYRKLVDEGVRVVQKERVDRVRERANAFDGTLRPAIRKALSHVDEAHVDARTFVAAGESVTGKNVDVIKDGITGVINDKERQRRVKTKRFVSLTDDEREAIRARENPDGTVSAADVAEVLGERALQPRSTRELIRENPALAICRPRSKRESEAAAALGFDTAGDTGAHDEPEHAPSSNGSDPAHTDVAGENVAELSEDDIKRYSARLLASMTSPEEEVVAMLEPRADGASVAGNLKRLTLPPSPADAAAYYEFHNLQIAFENVWQEVIDQGLVDLAEDAYHQIVERGGDPASNGHDPRRDPIGALTAEGTRVLLAARADASNQLAVSMAASDADVPGLPPHVAARVRDHRTGSGNVRDHRTGSASGGRWVGPAGGRGGAVAPGVVNETGDGSTTLADPLPDLLKQLRQRARTAYPFTVYAANTRERSVNFGILITYEQCWNPQAYQAGKLVKTVTLAPKETLKYSKKTTTRKKRSEKEVQTHLRAHREESTQTSRAEQEIVRKATTKTNFDLTSTDTVKVPISEAVQLDHSQTTAFKREASRESQDLKRAFHESVFKAAQEYKDETTTEVNVESSEEVEITESGEITNPNDEIAVTFLFYELQRRYKVFERIKRITPVILVAQEVPNPADIDADWVLEHDWILRRILLDDSFLPALDYLSQNVVGEEVALTQLKASVELQRRTVDEVKAELRLVRDRLAAYRTLTEGGLFSRATGVKKKKSGGGFFSAIPVVGGAIDSAIGTVAEVAEDVAGAAGEVGEFLFGDKSGEQGASRKDAMAEAMQRTADMERDLTFRLEREVTALNASTEAYAKALGEYYNHQVQIARLFDHITKNILYYMQGIWSHEPHDQRYFRLHQARVPDFELKDLSYKFSEPKPEAPPLVAMAHRAIDGVRAEGIYEAMVSIEVDPQMKFTTLAQVANLNDFRGFIGNLMIFGLNQSNPITDYMMTPYVVEGLNELIDPDAPGNWTLEEFSEYVCCLKKRLTEDQFVQVRDQLRAQYQQLLTTRLRDGDVLTVPTGALFIEALPAAHSLIEKFKAMHRAIDVKKAQAETRRIEMENIRYAARLLASELDDPDIDRKIVVEGASGVVVPPEA